MPLGAGAAGTAKPESAPEGDEFSCNRAHIYWVRELIGHLRTYALSVLWLTRGVCEVETKITLSPSRFLQNNSSIEPLLRFISQC
jgi:hypothetical protein